MATGRKRTDSAVSGRFAARRRFAARQGQPDDSETAESRRAPVVDEAKAREKVMAAALRLLSARARSEAQLRDKLLAKAWLDAALIDDCMARLKELGYVNDRQFALNYAQARLNIRSIGRSRLARELAEKKVSREIIDETMEAVFAEVAEGDLIDRAVEKHTRLHGRPTDPKGARKLMAHLMRRGFAYDLIAKKLRSIRFAGDEDEGDFPSE